MNFFKSRKAVAAQSDVAVLQRYGLTTREDIASARRLIGQGMSHEVAARKVREWQEGLKRKQM